MGPPTISADQRGRASRAHMEHVRRFNGAADDLGGSTISCVFPRIRSIWLQWGRRRSRRINDELVCNDRLGKIQLQWGRRRSRRINIARVHPALGLAPASMGPPTISADQRRYPPSCPRCRGGFNGAADDLGGSTSRAMCFTISSSRFNGAADDLGGSTTSSSFYAAAQAGLQWGRRRSRRINYLAVVVDVPEPPASMGPPTISADQPSRGMAPHVDHLASMGPPTISADQLSILQHNRIRTFRFNGAADDLGGSTVAASQMRSAPKRLQWGRRRSRRINAIPRSPLLARLSGRKSRTCTARGFSSPYNHLHHTPSASKNPVLTRHFRLARTSRAFAIDPGSRNAQLRTL